MKRVLLAQLLFFILSPVVLTAQATDPLILSEGDVYIDIVKSNAVGFDLWIRQKPGLNSIILTESTADPEKKSDSYTLRSYEYNEINGDEQRVLDGRMIGKQDGLYFLLDSSAEYNEVFDDMAFHIYVPLSVTYGYSWSREGQIDFTRGTWFSIRTFEKPYADYNGRFQDNPFILDIEELPPAPTVEENEEIVEEIAEETDGSFEKVENVEEAVDRISELLMSREGDVDLVLVVDTTISMKDDIDFIQQKLVPIVLARTATYQSSRVGLVLYRDYKEAYLTREFPFETSMESLQISLDSIRVSGGQDVPEAVYEGIYAALSQFDWQAPNRMIIQVGDAPPHDVPKGEITQDMVFEEASNLGVSIYPILLPDKATE